MSEQRPTIVVTVAAPVEAVWDALRDKDKIRHWHGWEFEGSEGGLDQEIDHIYFAAITEEDAQAGVLEIQGGDRFVVEPADGGTRVTLTRAAFGEDPEWDAYYDDVTEGWITFLQQLRFAVEQHAGDARRTLFYSGAGGQQSAADALGLTAPVGASYALELVGEPATGTVWFRSEHQVGITVDAWGNGLLVLSHVPPGPDKPAGAAMAILSLYGVDDETRSAIDKRWRDWWTTRHPEPSAS
ncbi:hypothetical protein Kfla_1746 [Kribbella flavida DSM 17836]|uniref:Activator of Hsp90 ATPase 1 family protein n=1 Tax=Kribbella flavida (strain DSM 17836 / JCM 10339 / NBRC 14399) TaxID=479435 RepID=D2PNI9_KRIFD|nr:SRPBCC domain-containing protein [Kribbella flavida]ADB30841.1 hypothetical protein Kfla_1746 [Kribbella flavida DSM 17836]